MNCQGMADYEAISNVVIMDYIHGKKPNRWCEDIPSHPILRMHRQFGLQYLRGQIHASVLATIREYPLSSGT